MKLMTKEDFKELNGILEECERLNNEDRVDEVLANFTTFNDFIYEKCQMTRTKRKSYSNYVHTSFTSATYRFVLQNAVQKHSKNTNSSIAACSITTWNKSR